ncbi:hypothetical protein Hte_005312 [Hypoxylon texense]
MAVAIPSCLRAFFPEGIDRNTFNFYLGDDSGNAIYLVENTSQNKMSDVLFQLRECPSVGPYSGAIGRVYKPDPETEFEVPNSKFPGVMCNKTLTEHGTIFSLRFAFEGRRDTHRQPAHQMTVEVFEWRHSQGREVHSLNPDPRATGYKLVRGIAGPGSGRGGPYVGGGGPRATRQEGESSDGKEIVAVWATVDGGCKKKKRPFAFRLLGSGATGELGDEFALAALVTALKIYSMPDPKMNHPIPPFRAGGMGGINMAI